MKVMKYLIVTLLIGLTHSQSSNLKITILSTMVADYDYIGEWGFSALVESDDNKVLFDTGFRPRTVLENADSLGIDLSTVEHVFLSHNHMDHTGGLLYLRRKLMKTNPSAIRYVHVGKGIFSERISNGINKNTLTTIKNELESSGIVFIVHEKPKEIFPKIWTTGIVPRKYNERNWSGYREILLDGKKVEDNIPEDQSLVINTKKGLVLISGCGHAGIVNTLEHASEIFQNKSNITTAIGGFHLFNKSPKDISWTAKHMRKHKISNFLGAHCTGIDAVYQIRKKNRMSRDNCSVAAVGSYYDLKDGLFPGLISK